MTRALSGRAPAPGTRAAAAELRARVENAARGSVEEDRDAQG